MKIIALIITVPVLLFFSIRFLENKSLYFPFRAVDSTPKDAGLYHEDLRIVTADGVRLSAWFIPSEHSRAVVLFSHGNGGNISHRLEKILILNRLGLDILIFDYRGYGESTGSPNEKGIYIDAETIYDYMVSEKQIPPRKIIGYGESLGGPVILELASRRNMAGVIIEEAFTSVKEMAKFHFPFIPASLLQSRYDTLEKIKNIKIPKLIFHSTDDEIVPYEQGKRLFESAPEPKVFIELRGGHNDAFIVSRETFSAGIDRFVAGLSK